MTEDEINLLAYSLLDKLEIIPISPKENSVKKERPIIGLGKPIQLGKIENAVSYKCDDYDNTILIHKVIDKNEVGFGEKSYLEIQNLTDKIIEIPYFSSFTDYKFIEREIFNWVVGIYESNKAEYELISYLKLKVEKELYDYEYFFKIFSLGIEKEFVVGKVTFTSLSKDFFDEEFNKMNYRPKESDSGYVNDMISDYTTKIVAKTKSYATKDKAYNLSLFHVKLSFAVSL